MSSMHITEYKLLVAPARDCDSKINALIKDGWQPFGPPSVLPANSEYEGTSDTAFQALVRHAKSQPPA
jgi:hypothetical protein